MTAAFLFLAAAAAAAQAPGGAAIPRKVLALYSGEEIVGEFKDITSLQLHERGEIALNHLGLEVVYHDAGKSLPDLRSLDGFRGVVTWFAKPVNFADPDPVCRWMDAAMARGLRVVILGDPGIYRVSPSGAPRLSAACAAMFKTLGFVASDNRAPDPLSVRVAFADPRVMGFERALDANDFDGVPMARLLPGGTAYLRLELNDSPPARSEPVALTRNGAIALYPFLLYTNRDIDPPQFRWLVDPFAFFEGAFRLHGLPRPDVTTLNGRRVFLSQIDGDGFVNPSEVDHDKWSGEVFLNEFLLRYSSTPFTTSLITAYYDLATYNGPDSYALSRKIFSLPNVEPASHGYAHPLVWHKGTVAVNVPGYTMDSHKEILGSVRFLNAQVAAPSKKVSFFQWTGDCFPSEAEIAMLEKEGLLGINGGGGRFDAKYPSYTYLWPLSRLLGSSRQIYAPMANEDNYTNLWQGPYYGYRDVIETFERTGYPRRVKPVDVYIHFYSAEKYAAVEALKKVYAWTEAQPLIPVWAARYVRSVRGFFDMRILRLGPERYRFEGGADLRTVRLDDTPLFPDLSASKGIIGFRRELGSLYVFFDESDTRELALTGRPPSTPYLLEADFEVTGWSRRGGGVRFLRQGWWTGQFMLAGLPPGKSYRVVSAGTDLTLRVDSMGMLRVHFPDSERGGPAREVVVEPAS